MLKRKINEILLKWKNSDSSKGGADIILDYERTDCVCIQKNKESKP